VTAFLSPSQQRPPVTGTTLVLVWTLLLFVTASCAPRHAPALSDLSGKYHPTRLATTLQARPGCIAWSRDSRTLAFIDKTVHLYDADSKEQRTVAIEAPHFLSWSQDNMLLVLCQEQGRDGLCSIDRESLTHTIRTVDAGAEAFYFAPTTGSLLLLSKSFKEFPFGTEFALRLSASDGDDRTPTQLYSFNKTYSMKQLDQRYLLAWTHAGLNPIDNSLLIIEHTKPPVVSYYSRVITVDLLTGEVREILGKAQNNVYATASWSPDGRLLALTRGNGRLEIRTLGNEQVSLVQSMTGLYPAWSPQGDRIYFGGYVIDQDGKNSDALLLNSSQSIAQWSPDGTKLAVATGNDLWLFNDMHPGAVPSAGTLDRDRVKKMSLIQTLFRDKLIPLEEYREQRDRLMKGPEGKD